ncbi:MAG TPA: phospho-sugar mutase [Firmicutes bacterium]|nr:phospho-sugar mutase [Bacillota bacterium]
MEAKQRYQAWLDDPLIDPQTRQELVGLAENDEEIEDRFFRWVEFGTGGIRAKLGAGSNRLNIYTVRLVSQALANNLKDRKQTSGGVVIAYDSRRMSREFTQAASAVLVGNGIPVYVFPDLAPTPLLSYAVRHCRAAAGIMITASHNPPEYNGVKVYNYRGNQLLEKEASAISSRMAALSPEDVTVHPKPEASGLFRHVEESVVQSYYRRALAAAPGVRDSRDLKILYTPLHGTGARFIPEILRMAGFTAVSTVAEQMKPDGEFPTVSYPNPEDEEAYACAFRCAEKEDYDLIIATDPDADRMGVAVPQGAGWVLLNGNQIGVLLQDFILAASPARKARGAVVIKTIVTTDMVHAIAEKYGAEVETTLTGFKYIGELIDRLGEQGRRFMFAFEESYGYLAGTAIRDKDAVLASLLIAEAAAYYKQRGLTLLDRLKQLFQEHGFYLQGGCSYGFATSLEAERAAELISRLQGAPINAIGGEQVVEVLDYAHSRRVDLRTNRALPIDLPPERVLQWITREGSKVTLRPSGTEPKMKLYLEVRAASEREGKQRLAALQKAFDEIVRGALGA